jgi:hypothetical protein
LGKKPYAKATPKPQKQAFAEVPKVEDRRPVWQLRLVDLEGPFSCKLLDAETLVRVVRRLGDFESMSWEEIGRAGSHTIDVAALHPDARKRLADIRQDDVDEVYSLRITGKERIFGIRDRWILRILWWDPDHRVCPSTLKHT